MRLAWGVALALVTSGAASAQEPAGESPFRSYTWMDVAYPKAFYTPRDGFTVGGYYAYLSQLGFADWDRPPAYRASFSMNGQASTSGSREVTLEARLPDLVRGWRVVGTFTAQRRARENYYGIGSQVTFDEANVTDAQPHYYQSLNVRYSARGEIQRQIVGPLRLLAGFHAERWRIDTLPGPGQLKADLAAAVDPTIARPTTEVAARAGVVLDLRDSEPNPRRGALIEAIYSAADTSVMGDLAYTRTSVSAAGYLSPHPQLVLAARVAGESMGGTPRLGAFYRFEASDRPYEGVGGAASHRALQEHRFLGRNKLFANLDVRFDAYAVPTLVRTTVVAFLDAGRVFEPEPFRLTTEGLQVGGGGGLFLQFGRAGILGSTVGVGPDGLVFQAHTRWTY